jgi:light-regulated signal transduction histidine kinase (bacteriophytochrome)
MVVPLIARGRTLGALTFAHAESGRHYDTADLALAQDLARRAALAVDNTRLYRGAQEARVHIAAINADLERQAGKLTAANAANKELEAFSYSVSHDLRAPLRAIDGFSRILLEEYVPDLPPEAQCYLGLVRQNADQMGQLIDDLLQFSRLSRKAFNQQEVRPAELVREVLADLKPEIKQRQVEFTIGDLPPCQADPALLRQVFANLLANSLKFTRLRPVAQIEVGHLEQDGMPTYFMKDNGVGFDMRYADKLFGVFQRLHRAEDYEGTGVGLATVQRVIQRHGGTIWADSTINQGTTFYFTVGGRNPSG